MRRGCGHGQIMTCSYHPMVRRTRVRKGGTRGSERQCHSAGRIRLEDGPVSPFLVSSSIVPRLLSSYALEGIDAVSVDVVVEGGRDNVIEPEEGATRPPSGDRSGPGGAGSGRCPLRNPAPEGSSPEKSLYYTQPRYYAHLVTSPLAVISI